MVDLEKYRHQEVKIGILRALYLGDLLCAVPALRAVRAFFPNAQISWIGLPWSNEFATRFSMYIDRHIDFPGYPGLPEVHPDIQRIPEFLKQIQQEKFDLVLQMHGSGMYVNSITALFGARQSAGFYLPGMYCPDPDAYIPYPDDQPEVIRHLQLIEYLGIPTVGSYLEFPIFPQDIEKIAAVQEEYHLANGAYVCVHPGSRAKERRWPVDQFAEVGKYLGQMNYPIVITGTPTEKNLADELAAKIDGKTVNLCGSTDLGGLAAVLTGARLLVCNDTGVSHVADALGTPSVVIFSDSDPNRWAPLDRELHRVVHKPGGPRTNQVIDEINIALQKERYDAVR
ncbi:MAG TPA: glycosyltransferase family 9 protein [Anaerolineaceae bacterium]|nr:glycosyltransferase family 9 protein [Anaerolineaceae bacterium]